MLAEARKKVAGLPTAEINVTQIVHECLETLDKVERTVYTDHGAAFDGRADPWQVILQGHANLGAIEYATGLLHTHVVRSATDLAATAERRRRRDKLQSGYHKVFGSSAPRAKLTREPLREAVLTAVLDQGLESPPPYFKQFGTGGAQEHDGKARGVLALSDAIQADVRSNPLTDTRFAAMVDRMRVLAIEATTAGSRAFGDVGKLETRVLDVESALLALRQAEPEFANKPDDDSSFLVKYGASLAERCEHALAAVRQRMMEVPGWSEGPEARKALHHIERRLRVLTGEGQQTDAVLWRVVLQRQVYLSQILTVHKRTEDELHAKVHADDDHGLRPLSPAPISPAPVPRMRPRSASGNWARGLTDRIGRLRSSSRSSSDSVHAADDDGLGPAVPPPVLPLRTHSASSQWARGVSSHLGLRSRAPSVRSHDSRAEDLHESRARHDDRPREVGHDGHAPPAGASAHAQGLFTQLVEAYSQHHRSERDHIQIWWANKEADRDRFNVPEWRELEREHARRQSAERTAEKYDHETLRLLDARLTEPGLGSEQLHVLEQKLEAHLEDMQSHHGSHITMHGASGSEVDHVYDRAPDSPDNSHHSGPYATPAMRAEPERPSTRGSAHADGVRHVHLTDDGPSATMRNVRDVSEATAVVHGSSPAHHAGYDGYNSAYPEAGETGKFYYA